LHLLDDRDERRQFAQVAPRSSERGILVLNHLDLGIRLPWTSPKTCSPAGKKLGKMPAVLAGDAGD